MVRQRLVALLEFEVPRCLVGTQHHAVVGVDIYQPQPHDLKPVLDGARTSRPEATDMRSLLARLADVTGVDGYGLAPPGAEVAQGKGGIETEPVQALRAKATEVLAVALFAVPAVAAHLGEVYLAWYDHV